MPAQRHQQPTRLLPQRPLHKQQPLPKLQARTPQQRSPRLTLRVNGWWNAAYRDVPRWFWHDLRLLINTDEPEPLLIDPLVPLHNSQQAVLILLNTPQTAAYANNLFGLDERVIAALNAKDAAICATAKAQLWQLLRHSSVQLGTTHPAATAP